jgi:hypothetical protein
MWDYRDLVHRLLRHADRSVDSRSIDESIITMSPEADALLVKIHERLEPHLGVNGALEPFGDWVGKLVGTVVRIAGVIHAVENSDDPSNSAISESAVARADRIGTYLLAHARAAFALMCTDPQTEKAKRIAHWIGESRCERFSKRDAFNALRAHFKRVTEIEEPLHVLQEHHVIRPAPPSARSGPGRPRSPEYEVSPHFLAQNAHNPQNQDESERAAIREHGGG